MKEPLTTHQWRSLADGWDGSHLEVFPIATTSGALYKLTLPDKEGIITGSSLSCDIYAVLLRYRAEELFTEVMNRVEAVAYL
ncbi:MAG: hypothetical protein NZZ60_06205 [Bacteroidia bacterium]|nr:hypothetical protein [Bacteroidia bacterium]MDW8416811.1 hypothetical protein [Bacteroidia bacterium]